MSNFINRLQEYIDDGKWTLTKIQQQTNIQHSNLSEYLSDKHLPSYENLLALLDLFNCSADYLLALDEIHTEEPLHPALPFGERLRAVMKERKVSQGKMIRDMKISSSALYNWLSGKTLPSTDRLIRIAQYLDCSVDYLIGRRR